MPTKYKSIKNRNLNNLALLCLVFFPALAQSETVTETIVYPDTFNDWKYNQTANTICGGYYSTPKFAEVEGEPGSGPISISADYSSLSVKGNSMLMGDVLVEQPGMRLTADQISYYRDPQTEKVEYASAEGNVLIEEPDARLFGKEANVDLRQERIDLQDAEFRIYPAHARGSAAQIHQQRDQPTYLEQVNYTTCAPDSNVWEVRAKNVMLDQDNNRGVARNAWIYIKDIPIAYTPYISFPLSRERKSGFLSPLYGTSNISGAEFATPYYLNLAPNYDATITPHWYSKRDFQLQAEFRYLFPQMDGIFYGEWLPDDPDFADFREDNLAGITTFAGDPQAKALRDESDNRQAFFWNHEGQLSPQWLMSIDYEYVSDDNYISDLNPAYFDLNSRVLERQIQTEYYSRYWSLYGRALDYQNLQPFDASIQEESYNVLPQFLWYGDYPDKFTGINYGLMAETAVFTHDHDIFTDEPVTTGNRYDATPEISWQGRRSYGFFIPRGQLSYTAYELNVGTLDTLLDKPSTPTRTLPIFDIDSGLYFDRDFNLFGRSYSQSLEPRLFYLYVPNKDQNDLPVFDSGLMEFNFNQMFRTNRFSGYDRIGDANQLTYAVINRFSHAKTGEEQMRLSVGQILYFEDRDVTICESDIDPDCGDIEDPNSDQSYSPFVGELYYRISRNWSGLAELQWDPDTVSSLDQRRFVLRYRDSTDRVFNLGYSFINQGNPLPENEPGSSKNNLEQIDTSVGWRVLPQWNVLAGIEYDFINDFTVENFAGVEYENCCWAVRVGQQRYLTINSSESEREFDEQYFIQFSLKGLADVGNSPGGLFNEKVEGYQDTFGKRY